MSPKKISFRGHMPKQISEPATIPNLSIRGIMNNKCKY